MERPERPVPVSRLPIVVCERTGKWADALRWALPDDRTELHETRSPQQARDEIRAIGSGLLAVGWSEDRAAALLELIEWTSRQPGFEIAVLASANDAAWESVARELGATLWLTSAASLLKLRDAAKRWPPDKAAWRATRVEGSWIDRLIEEATSPTSH